MSFAETFAGTLEYAPKVLEDTYEGSGTRLTTFPPLEHKVPDLSTVTAPPTSLARVTLKSIRAPKFTVEYDVPLADSIYSLKERLLTDPSGPLQGATSPVSPSSMKILIKSKVVHDTRQLAELSSTSFIVMFVNNEDDATELQTPLPAQIYWGEEAALLNKTASSEPQQPNAEKPVESTLPGINDQFWKDVEAVARRYVADPKDLVQTMRKNVDNVAIETDLD